MTDTIPAPFSGSRYDLNASRTKASEDPCAICGKGIKPSNPRHWVHVIRGGAVFAPIAQVEEIDPAGDMGWYPIGTECARKLPRAHRTAKAADSTVGPETAEVLASYVRQPGA